MTNGNLFLIFCIVAFLGLGLPLSIFLAARRGGEIELFRRAGERARAPWKPEDDDLSELAKRVESLKDKSGKPS